MTTIADKRDEIAGWMNRLPFVRWDRLVEWKTADRQHDGLTVYGWISRPDGRSDFVVMEFNSWSPQPGFSTSSAERSQEIHDLLYGPSGDDHFPCQRVEEYFGDLVENKVVLA